MFIVDSNLRCNFENRPEGPCTYCYNTSPRRNFRDGKVTDIKVLEDTLRKEFPKKQGGIILHGGEPLYMEEKILKKLLKLSFELSGRSNIQTNGSLISDKKIKLFKKYKTHIGVSVDGYWPANKWRGKTKKNTDLVINNILKLKKAGVATAVLMTIHKNNVAPEKIKYIEKLILDFSKEGIPSKVNLIYHPDSKIEISPEQAKSAYLRLANFVVDNNLSNIRPFQSIVNALLGKRSECTFQDCDPFCTHATHVTAGGVPNLCGRFDNEIFYQGDFPVCPSFRWNLLSQTDCKGCRYGGKVCFGGCPAVARDWDWRNKDRFCEAYYVLFEFFEKKLKALLPFVPLKTEPNFKPSFPEKQRPINVSDRRPLQGSSHKNESIKK
ncbi:MAG: radical SAM protein [Candidatus Nealsonbacteria bacterium]